MVGETLLVFLSSVFCLLSSVFCLLAFCLRLLSLKLNRQDCLYHVLLHALRFVLADDLDFGL